MLNANSPRAGSARAVNCLLGGDVHGHITGAMRAEVLASRFHIPSHRAHLIAPMIWEVAVADYPAKPAALSLLTHPGAAFDYRTGQFLGGIAFSDRPLTERQERWLSALLKKHGLPPLAAEKFDG